MRLILFASLMISLTLFSCQKEIDWGLNSGTDGDLLVKALQVTPATNDTNVITFTYDGNRRLLEYRAIGKVNGQNTDIKNVISRLSDGKISKIIAKSSLLGGFVDSVVYFPRYNGTKLDYVLDTQYTLFGNIGDSTAYTYNGAGLVTEKITFTDFLGSLEPISKETYVYDAMGNVLTITSYSPDGAGGFDLAATTTATYNSRKNAVSLGEESYIVFPATNISKNDITKQVTTAVGIGGTSYTTTVTQQQYNSYNRPTKANMSVTPQPPGYDLKLLYYYQ